MQETGKAGSGMASRGARGGKPENLEIGERMRRRLLPALFPIDQDGEPLDVSVPLGGGGELRVIGPCAMRPSDERLLCVILFRAAQERGSAEPGRLPDDLRWLADGMEAPVLARIGLKELAEAMGRQGDADRMLEEIEDAIGRMSDIALIHEAGGRRSMFHLLSRAAIGGDGMLALGVNPVIAECIMGPGSFTARDMESLKRISDDEVPLFIQLVNCCVPGKARNFTGEDLREMVFGPIPDVSPGSMA